MILNYTSQQNELRKHISLQNNFSVGQIKLVAGVDIAYWGENNKEYGACCIQVIDF